MDGLKGVYNGGHSEGQLELTSNGITGLGAGRI